MTYKGSTEKMTYKNTRGYTLVELALSLMVLGIIIAGVAAAYTQWRKIEQYEQTVYQINNKVLNLAAFRAQQGRYPRPAPLGVSRDDPRYGYEACVAPDHDPDSPDYDDGSDLLDCTADMGIQDGRNMGFFVIDMTNALSQNPSGGQTPRRDAIVDAYLEAFGVADENDLPFGIPGEIRVFVGGIPFRSLNLPEDFAYDSYGNRLYYAVTEIQTKELPPYSEKAGAIGVFEPEIGGIINLDRQPHEMVESLTTPPYSAEFIVFSTGPNREGGFTREGIIFGGLTDDTPFQQAQQDGNVGLFEANNVAFDDDGTDVSGGIAEEYGASFFLQDMSTTEEGTGAQSQRTNFDDMGVYRLPRNVPMWVPVPGSSGDIYSLKHVQPEGVVSSSNYYPYFDAPSYDPRNDPQVQLRSFDEWWEDRPFFFDTAADFEYDWDTGTPDAPKSYIDLNNNNIVDSGESANTQRPDPDRKQFITENPEFITLDFDKDSDGEVIAPYVDDIRSPVDTLNVVDFPQEADDKVRFWVGGSAMVEDERLEASISENPQEFHSWYDRIRVGTLTDTNGDGKTDERDFPPDMQVGKIKALGYCNVPIFSDYESAYALFLRTDDEGGALPTTFFSPGSLVPDEDGQAEEKERANFHDCFPSAMIGGEGIQCPLGQVMVGIANGKPECRKEITTDCGDMFVRGFGPRGRVYCDYLPCPAMTARGPCDRHIDDEGNVTRATPEIFSLPASNHGTYIGELADGPTSCVQVAFICNNGVWEREIANEQWCDCSPTREPEECDFCLTESPEGYGVQFNYTCEEPAAGQTYGSCYYEEPDEPDRYGECLDDPAALLPHPSCDCSLPGDPDELAQLESDRGLAPGTLNPANCPCNDVDCGAIGPTHECAKWCACTSCGGGPDCESLFCPSGVNPLTADETNCPICFPPTPECEDLDDPRCGPPGDPLCDPNLESCVGGQGQPPPSGGRPRSDTPGLSRGNNRGGNPGGTIPSQGF